MVRRNSVTSMEGGSTFRGAKRSNSAQSHHSSVHSLHGTSGRRLSTPKAKAIIPFNSTSSRRLSTRDLSAKMRSASAVNKFKFHIFSPTEDS